MALTWTFREMARGEINVDPVHDEFFKAQDLADALVREAIQNSLDARRGNTRVRVSFRFGTLDAERAERWLRGLQEHLDSVSRDSRLAFPSISGSMPWLAVEDFGTRGLVGDPDIDPELDASLERNDWFYFWRNVGRNNKGTLDRGRWGLGKAVFSVASQIRTFYGITRRQGDDSLLLMGQSVLKTHILDHVRHDPYGFFTDADRKDPLPVEKARSIERFREDFQAPRDEPGLSVVIPFPKSDELTVDKLVATTIAQYFYPIIRGDLVVTIADGPQTTTIDAQTIDAVATRHLNDADRVTRLSALTKWSLTLGDDIPTLHPPDERKAPKWSDQLFSAIPLEMLRQRFESGERIAFRVPIAVRRSRSRAANSWFDVFLEHDADLERGEHHFIRRGITIPEVKSGAEKPVRALAVFDHEALSTLLGDAENPAHSDWSERADKVRQYEYGASTIRFVKHSIAYIAGVVARPPAGRVRDFFSDVFSVEVPDGELDQPSTPGDQHPADGEDEGTSPGVHVPVGSRRRNGIGVDRTRDGFVIRGRASSTVGSMVEAEVAYRLRSGNPFRKYNTWDFDLGGESIALTLTGALLAEKGDNRFRFVPTSPDFQVALTGFDPHRDLIVRITESKGEHAPEAELH